MADFATAAQLYVNPNECVGCGAFEPVCPTTSIYPPAELPASLQHFAEKNAAAFN